MSPQLSGSAGRLALTVVVAAALAVGCGDDPGGSAEVTNPVAQSDAPDPPVTSLTCSSNRRSLGIADHFADGGGHESPAAAVEAFAPGDDVVLDESAPRGPTAWILRPDGTAHSQVQLRQLPDSTWVIETHESCSDRVRTPQRSKEP